MNKEIREYQESMFFGLSLRQSLFSLLAVIAAIVIYFSGKDVFGADVTGWLCMAGAVPFAFCGFFTYHGMTAEQFLWAFIKSELLYPKRLVYRPEDLYVACIMEGRRERKKQSRWKKKERTGSAEKRGEECH